jgi:hypothetical protein
MEQKYILEACQEALQNDPSQSPRSLIGTVAPSLVAPGATGKLERVETVDVWIVEEVQEEGATTTRPRSQRALICEDGYAVEALSQIYSFPAAREISPAAPWEGRTHTPALPDYVRDDFANAVARWSRESKRAVRARILHTAEPIAQYSVGGGVVTHWIHLRQRRVLLTENTMPTEPRGALPYVLAGALGMVYVMVRLGATDIALGDELAVKMYFGYFVVCLVNVAVLGKWQMEDARVRFDTRKK